MRRRIAVLLLGLVAGIPALYADDYRDYFRRDRDTGKKVAIVAGSTAAGAAVGALVGGARGAAAGAVAGGSGGALYAATDHDGRKVRRTGWERARIIGAGTGAGAAAGAIAGGGKGALIGAGIGAAGGYILDERTRRDRRDRWDRARDWWRRR
jgi:hypothetical protein